MSDLNAKKIRALKSCTLCRQKKVKCDKERPVCGTCSKRNRAHLCHYEKQEWTVHGGITGNPDAAEFATMQVDTFQLQPSAQQKVKPEFVEPSIKVKQYKVPVAQDQTPAIPNPKPKPKPKSKDLENEHIDFYSNTFASPISFSQGALTWVSLLKKDRFMNAVALSHTIRTTVEKFEAKAKAEGEITVNGSQFMKKFSKEFPDMRGIENEVNFKEKEIDLIRAIEAYLTSSKLVWISIDKFFDSEHILLFPYIEKDDFVENLSKLIGLPNSSTDPVKLTVSKAIDLALLGILLIILRFISFSPYNFGKTLPNVDTDLKFIMENPTPQSVSSLINRIHTEIKSIKTPSLQLFQFVSMRLFFEMYSPEECDCLRGADSGKLGELLQYAVTCSLNRDPEIANTSLLPPTEKNKNLSRRLWYMVIFLDLVKFMNVGYPPLVDETFYDTKLPTVDRNIQGEYETVINGWVNEREKCYGKIKGVLKLVLNIKVKPTIAQVKTAIIPLIESIDQMDSLEKIMTYPSETLLERSSNFRKLIIALQANGLLFTIYFHFFIFYCERQDVESSVTYLIKLIKVTKVLYHPVLFIDPNIKDFNLHKTFGSATLTFPKLELGFHRIAQMFFTILSRIKGLKLLNGSNLSPQVLNVLDEIVDVTNKAFSYIMTQYVKASDVYYHVWLISKVQVAIVSKILRIPKGAITKDYRMSEDDQNFKKSLDKTASRNPSFGDLGFEKYSIDDFKRILNELKSLEDVFNHGTNNPSPNSIGLPRKKKRKTAADLNTDVINENDKRWFDRMLNEFGQGDEKKSYLCNPLHHVPHQKFSTVSSIAHDIPATTPNFSPSQILAQSPESVFIKPSPVVSTPTQFPSVSQTELFTSSVTSNDSRINESRTASDTTSPYDNIENLNNLLNGGTSVDELFNFSFDNFFGFNNRDQESSWYSI